MTLSVLIVAKNEEKNIKDCIESANFAEEIIVIDDFSTDNTKEISEELGAKVYQRALNGDWGGQQTFAVQQASNEWIFFLDADERITPELAEEIKAAVRKNENYAYKVSRLNHVMGELIRRGGWYPDYVIRLLPRQGTTVEGLVHQQICHQYKEKKLKNSLIHYTYVSWEQYFNKFNMYTKLAAEKNYQKGKRAYFFRDIILRPWFAFFKKYILQAGWLDGRQGFILAVFYCLYTMVKYVKLYYIQKNN